jgi:hypothetical protein
VARAGDAEVIGSHVTAPPTLTNAARASNFSGYSFVSPMSLGTGDELDDEPDAYESLFSSEIVSRRNICGVFKVNLVRSCPAPLPKA